MGIAAVPVEDPVGGVGILLDFEDDEAGADGVDASAGEEHGIALGDVDAVEAIGDGAVGNFAFELGAGDALTEADVERGAGFGLGDEPEFGLGLAAEGSGLGGGGGGPGGRVCPGHRGF